MTFGPMAASGRSDHYLSRKPVFIPVEWSWLSGEDSEVAVTVTLLKLPRPIPLGLSHTSRAFKRPDTRVGTYDLWSYGGEQ